MPPDQFRPSQTNLCHIPSSFVQTLAYISALPPNPVRRIVTEFADLSVQLVKRDIIVTMPETGYSVVYRKDGKSPLLFAVEGIDRTDIPSRVQFWARAWKAAHQKARAAGWLNS